MEHIIINRAIEARRLTKEKRCPPSWEKSVETSLATWAQKLYQLKEIKNWYNCEGKKVNESRKLFDELIIQMEVLDLPEAYISLDGNLEKAIGDALVFLDAKFFVFEAKKTLACSSWKREGLPHILHENGKNRVKQLECIMKKNKKSSLEISNKCHFLIGFDTKKESIQATKYWEFIEKGNLAFIKNKCNEKLSVKFEYEKLSLSELVEKGCSYQEILIYVEDLLDCDANASGEIVGLSKEGVFIAKANDILKVKKEINTFSPKKK